MPIDPELEMWKQWKATGSPLDMEKIIKKMNPLIQSEVNKRAGTLARPLLELQAKKLTAGAIESFDLKRNVKLSTHVVNQLQKLSRVNYSQQNAARIPEHSMLQFHSYQVAVEDFKTEHGRDPSTEELSDTLKWSSRKLEQFKEQFGRSELLESGETPSDLFVPHTHDPRLAYAYQSMSPRQQRIFAHSTGYQGAEKLSNTALMAKLGITQGVLSYEKGKIREMLRKIT